MARTNLSTRPFYNERAVHLTLGVVTALVLAFTAFNLWQVFALSSRQAGRQERLSQADTRSRNLRAQTQRIRATINPRDLDATIAAAAEANEIISRRVFSWTELLNRFESTLPDTVRITSVRPRTDRNGTMTLGMVVVARSVDGVDAFIENLERDGRFTGVLSREEFVNEAGLLQATLEGRYLAGATMPATPKGRAR